MFKVTLRVTASCPHHRRYNPERDGLAFKSACGGCQQAHNVYLKVMELRRHLSMIGSEDSRKGLLTVEQSAWKYGPTECANVDCKKDLRKVKVIYTIRGKEIGFCSQACRATLTQEQVQRAPAMDEIEAAETEPRTISKKSKAPSSKATATVPRIKTATQGTLHIVHKDQKFHGKRAIVWGLIKEGMTVQALYEACAAAGVDGKGTLRLIMVVGKGCVEIR